MKREKTEKEKIAHRIKIIKGHLCAIEKMIENDEYCVDIIHQSLAVQKALKRMDKSLLRDHLSCCVVDQMKTGRERQAVEELLKLYEMK